MKEAWLRSAILAVADRDEIERVVRGSRFTQGLVTRFVAGDSVDAGLEAATKLASRGLKTSLDQLGENVLTPVSAQNAAESYAETLRAMAAAKLEPNISVKLTMLGLDIDEDLAREQMIQLLETASEVDGFVRIDMEGSAYTGRTLAIAEFLHERFPRRVGTVIQAYLHRSDRDIDRLINLRMRVRLVKGAYAEPPAVALQKPGEIDEAFIRQMERLLEHSRYPAIATHDPALIRATQGFALRMGIVPDRWEFQMLYGVRRSEQEALACDGYGMRIYVPFGVDWYPYFARRIAERPANIAFVLRQIFSRGE